MVPYRTSQGVRYQPLTIRLVLPESPAGANSRQQRAGCFGVPVVHTHFLLYLHHAKLRAHDFVGERRAVLAERLLKAAAERVGPSLYAGIEFVEFDSAPLDPTSRTLSTQCR
jgi:hypothetical protein